MHMGVHPLEVAAESGAGDAETRGNVSLAAVHGLADSVDVCPHRAGQSEIVLAGLLQHRFLFPPVPIGKRGSGQ